MGAYIYQFDIAALIFLIIILWMLIKFKNMPTETTQHYKGLLIAAICASAFDLFAVWVLEDGAKVVPQSIQYIAQILYLIPNMLCAVFYYYMTCSMTQPFRKNNRFRKYLGLGLFLIDTVFVISSPFNHLLFEINNETGYTHGPLMNARYALAAFIIIFALIDTVRYHRLLTRSQKSICYGYTIASMSSLVLQATLFQDVLLINFAIAISTLLGFFALQSPADFKDSLTGLNNKRGFDHLTESFFQQKDKFSVLCIDYFDINYVRKLLGEEATLEIVQQLSARLSSQISKSWLYRLSFSRFAIVLPHRSENLAHIAIEIMKQGETPVQVDGIPIKLRPTLCAIHAPESAAYYDDITDALEFGLTKAKQQSGIHPFYDVDEEAVIKKRRDSAILHTLKRVIAVKEFEVAYQPIFNPEIGSYTRAEALARLNDQVIGAVSPAEFIPIAEKNGLIIKLGEIIIDNVCHFIKKNVPSGSKFAGVSINLSPIQCMQSDFADSVIDIIRKNNISPSMIGFELTSDILENVGETLIPNIKRLSELGVRFTVDNYSVNISDSFLLEKVHFETIKISRDVTSQINSGDHILPAMRNSIAALKELGYEVVATGVETSEMATVLKGFGCDLLQGYLYSAPVSAQEMAKMISEN